MNLSDKDLDRLFREASDRFEPDDEMLSWNRLEKNLAGQLPERPPGPARRFGLRPMVWVPAAVIFAGLSFFLIKNHQNYRSLSTPRSSTTSAPVSSVPAAGSAAGSTPAATAPGAVTAVKEASPAVAASGSGNGNKLPAAGAANGSVPSPSVSEVAEITTGSKTTGAPQALPRSAAAAPSSGPVAASLTASNNRNHLTDRNTRSSTALSTATGKNTGADKKSKNTRLQTLNSRADPAAGLRSQAKETEPGNAGETVNYAERKNDRSPRLPGNAGYNQNGLEQDPPAAVSARAVPAANQPDLTGSANTAARRPEFAVARLPSPVRGAAPAITKNKFASSVDASAAKPVVTSGRSVELRHPFTIGLVMGPDYTDGGVTSNQLGNSVGISLGYYLTNRLSVNTGILYGVKSYSAQGQHFQPPPPQLRAFGSYPHFESANGTVTLFEIPLSLRYDFPIDGKTRLFVNAGLSSYLPLKETLTTYYHERGFLIGEKNINHHPEAHWFAIGHFSGGIERDLGKGISFQVEPYLNLPFTNVCTGNVKLNTYGLLISIRFSPLLSRKKG